MLKNNYIYDCFKKHAMKKTLQIYSFVRQSEGKYEIFGTFGHIF